MSIDQLVRAADPAATVSIPSWDSPMAQGKAGRLFQSARGGTTPRTPRAFGNFQPGGRTRAHITRRRLYLLAPASAVVVALVVAITVTSGTVGPSGTAAAAVLDQAASAAARSAPLVLHRGEFLYTRTRSLSDSVYQERGVHFNAVYVYTVQTWQTSAGVGKTVYTYNSPVTINDGTRPAWIKAGRPRLIPKSRRFAARMAPPRTVPLDNLSHLPTDPASLATEIKQDNTGLAGIRGDVEDPSTPGGTFYVAMFLLTEPSVGGSPALRSALFRVMAAQPGDKVLGHARAHDGRRGIAILTPPLGAHGTDVFEVIVSPKTGQVLEYDEYTRLGGFDEQWSDYLSVAAVHRIGQLPGRAAGSERR